ncbi:SpaA isopeptide-forming pilin-related protein [Lactococcus lactis]|uniref:SpaA isopeptide-forming pilin-related protein n=1 Tax=Lactococcus lactis TaxID=1358 RepID=UPI00288EE0E5|nr:SpaA isopeptide-forming pilin-related protein [Lactococcus lactis]MDT2879696.1 SpaA isopeptide-forming pilin-related protein [Lactococcus lactis]MDT2885317.1 SpaA isopeptide-forming pilin-related protein [Lactococcus lactis]MDT2896057.1 SpaA isopeptide-forming pilin-related protein [Lactococcus lactis]MDT2922812.1 SpaA isopeptide-forming pilin-related protein [Lactococcus lactis]
MSKKKKLKFFIDWKTGKKFVLVGGILLAIAGSSFISNQGNHVDAVTGGQDTVVWEPGKALAHLKLTDGSTTSVSHLTRKSDGLTVYCIGLGVPLTNSSTSAQEDAMNEIWTKLSSENQAIINNISYLAHQQGSASNMDLYLGAQLAEWKILHEGGAGKNDVSSIESFGDGNPNGSIEKVNKYRDDLISQAKKLVQKPSFTGTTIPLIMGVPKNISDTNGVLSNFPIIKNNTKGLSATVNGNNLKLQASFSTPLGTINNAIQMMNKSQETDYQPFVYSTDGDSSGGSSQSIFVGTDPSRLTMAMNVNVIGLGETTLLKHDADTNSTDTQGEAQLTGSVWGLYKAGTNTLVKYSDGQDGYPVAVTNGEKVDDKQVQLKLTDLTKGVGVKNLDNSADYEWGEVKAPEGYELSTKRYKVHFDDKDKFDDKTSNYIDDVTALDRVLRFNFGYIKAQDVNGSLTGLNGRAFRLTPQGDTKGDPIEVTSSQSEDASGFINNGQVNFSNINFGDYLLEELPQDNDKLQLINPISVTTNTNKDKDGDITGYTVEFKDTVTQQVITTLDVPISKTTDNNTMFKVNLGTLVDKPVTPVVPTIKTQAHSKDGDKIIQINEVSEKTPIYDIADFTNVLKGDQILSYVHRRIIDKDGKVTSDKLLQTLKYVADDETVKTQQHRFDTTVDTTKDFDIPDGSKVTYVFTENDFDASANPETDEPKAKHDDLKDQDQTLTVDKVTPSIDVEKANAKVPDAGNGNHTDKDNNVGVNDHDTEDTYFEVKPNAETKIFFRGTNNGTEPLTHIKVVDKTTNGSVNIKGMTFTYNDKKLSVNKDGEFELDGKLLVLQPKESVIGSGTLDALPEGELHGDKVTIDGIGVYSKKHVSDDDKWYGKVDEKPKSIVEKVAGSLPTTGEGKAALGISIFGVALLGLAAYLKRQWIVTTYRRVIGKIRK